MTHTSLEINISLIYVSYTVNIIFYLNIAIVHLYTCIPVSICVTVSCSHASMVTRLSKQTNKMSLNTWLFQSLKSSSPTSRDRCHRPSPPSSVEIIFVMALVLPQLAYSPRVLLFPKMWQPGSSHTHTQCSSIVWKVCRHVHRTRWLTYGACPWQGN